MTKSKPSTELQRRVDRKIAETRQGLYCDYSAHVCVREVTDATLAEIAGVWRMFVNVAEEGASKNDELHLYYAETPLGPWRPHRRPRNPPYSSSTLIRQSPETGQITLGLSHLACPSTKP